MRWRSLVGIAVLLVQSLTLGVLLPGIAAAETGGIVISQLQTAGVSRSTDEFVELENLGPTEVSLAGWSFQYRAASTTNGTDCTKGWTTKATVAGGTIAAGGHYLFAPTIFLTADSSFSAGLAAAGTVRLLDAGKTPVDSLAWGAASCGAGAAASAPAAGQSLERQANTGNNAADFAIQSQVVAHSATANFPLATAPEPASDSLPEATPAPTVPTEPGMGAGAVGKLEISELMVDPVAPYSDAQDEFVEIHNSGDTAVDATGYAVKTGSHVAKLPDGVILPDGYVVLTSANTTISLANTGGVANLLNPAGEVVDTAGAWGSAVPGASWAFVDGSWLWTLTPTPGAANQYTPVPGTAGAEGSGDYAEVQLSELLPDPASPLTDANDEYIEIYNPNDQEVDLTGYVIKAGHDLGSKFIIKDVTVAAGGYVALKSSQTKLALSNDGSSVALYTPAGQQLGTTVTYGKAPTGASWAYVDGVWLWTAEPTPGAGNVLMSVEAAAAKAAATKATKAKAASKAKAAAKAKTAKKAKATKASGKPLVAGSTSPGGRWLLIILAGLTIAYIIYEFRYDIRNYYHRLRGLTGGRPAPVPIAIAGHGDRIDQRSRRR